jgi:hypothetical protein
MDLSPPCLFRWAFFWSFFTGKKKKPAIDIDAGFPVFSRPQLLGMDFVGNHATKSDLCLHAMQHTYGQEKTRWVTRSGLKSNFGRVEETWLYYCGTLLKAVSEKPYSL